MEAPQPLAVRRRRRHRFLGVALVVAGVLLVVSAGGYYLFGWIGTQGLDSLVYVSDAEPPAQRVASTLTLEGLWSQASLPLSPGLPPDPISQRLYPGERIAFTSWVEPWAAEPPPIGDEELVQGFLPVERFLLGEPGTLPPATRISIPAIELEAEVQGLGILDLGDYRQYETPDRVVGHIPDTANPGEMENGWLFGHLQSPLRNEGAVFQDLPRIPDILRTGQRVYVILDSPVGSYLYEVYETDVIYQDDLQLYGTDDATVTLVVCVPALKYDYRLLVTAQLVGFKPVV